MSLGHNTVRLPLLAAVILLASSCSVARRVQTARSVELRAEITQMPTVAELDVAPVRVEVDTTWTNHLFKGSTPVEAQREALVARALAGGSADLLVEPKVRHEANRHWFRTEHRLTVSGYPARYERFRSATLEDIRTINAVRCPDTVRTTLVLAETLRPTPRKGASLGKAVSVTTPKPVRARGGKFRERRSGYRGLVEGSYINLTTSSDFRGDGFAFSTIHGRQCGKHFFAGLGVGVFKANAERLNSGYDDYGYTDSKVMVPFFLNAKAYLLKSRFSPYVEVRGGYEVSETESYYLSGGIGLSYSRFELGANYFQFDGLSGIQARLAILF